MNKTWGLSVYASMRLQPFSSLALFPYSMQDAYFSTMRTQTLLVRHIQQQERLLESEADVGYESISFHSRCVGLF